MSPKVWQALVRPGKRLQVGARFKIIGGPSHHALDVSPIVEVIDVLEGGIRGIYSFPKKRHFRNWERLLYRRISIPLYRNRNDIRQSIPGINGSVADADGWTSLHKRVIEEP